MALSDLLYLEERLSEMVCVEDLFGDKPDAAAMEENYFSLQAALGGIEGKMTDQLKATLAKHYDAAQNALSAGTYGERKTTVVKLRHPQYGEFCLNNMINSSEMAKTYFGTTQRDGKSAPIIVKIANGSNAEEVRASSNLLSDEAGTLKALWRDSDDPNLFHLPELYAQFALKGKQVNVLQYCLGHDFVHVRLSDHHKNGVAGRHIAWILQRTLPTLSYCHSRDIVHGNINPEHLILDPVIHNVSLIGWQHSVKTGSPYKAVRGDYAAPESLKPEVLALPASDVYSLGKSVIYLAGGNLASNELPEAFPRELKAVLMSMVLPSPLQRPKPFELFEQVDAIRHKLFGGRQYVEFPI